MGEMVYIFVLNSAAVLPIITIHWLGTGEMVYIFVLNSAAVLPIITIHWLGTGEMVYIFVLNSAVVLLVITIHWLGKGEMVYIFRTEQYSSLSNHFKTLVRYRGNDLHFCTEQCGLANLPIIAIHCRLGTGEMVYLLYLTLWKFPLPLQYIG